MALNEKVGDSLVSIGQKLKTDGASAIVVRQCGLWALIGAVVIGVTLPTLLVCWNCGGLAPMGFVNANSPGTDVSLDRALTRMVENWILLQIIATIFCGPGAVILGLVLYSWCKKRCINKSKTLRETIVFGMCTGVLAAFLNLPGYLSVNLVRQDSLLLVPLLFAVAGASCGAWVAWQAWRAVHPEENFWPRFSLGTLLLFVIGWGALMLVFAPKSI